MAGRELEAVSRAVDHYLGGKSVRASAAEEGISPNTLHRALKKRGITPRGPLTGTAHPAYIDGRTAERAARRQSRA